MTRINAGIPNQLTNNKNKVMEILFKIYESADKPQAKAIVKDGKCLSIKLIVRAPKGCYYSLLNDAAMAFQELYPQYH